MVVSSAGSGKTSSIVGKVKYLIEIKKVDPKRILLISYTNKAAAELTERMNIPGLRGYTFHKLALDIIGQVTGQSDQYPYGEERRLFYVAITRAKFKTYVLYDKRLPSVFVNEFLHPEKVTERSYVKHPNAKKKWTRQADSFLLTLYEKGESIKYIAEKMGRSQTSIVMRLGKLGELQ